MHFQPLLALAALTSLTSALALAPRAAQDVLNDISTIQSQTATVQRDVDNFPGGPLSALQALQIKADSDALAQTIQKAARDAVASAPFTDAESASVANAVTGLQKGVYKVLDSLVAKKKGFETAVFGASAVPIVKDTLVGLRRDTAAFGANVTTKFVPVVAKVAPLVVSNLDFHFARAVDAFS